MLYDPEVCVPLDCDHRGHQPATEHVLCQPLQAHWGSPRAVGKRARTRSSGGYAAGAGTHHPRGRVPVPQGLLPVRSDPAGAVVRERPAREH